MDKLFVITVGRQFGSGGRDLGKRLAEMLSIDYYDKELINVAAEESGLSSEYFARADEKLPSALSYGFNLGFGYGGALTGETIFKYQSDVIRSLASGRSCVIVGRCADYILRDHPCCINIFLSSSKDDRVERITKRDEFDSKKAEELMTKIDKGRAGYYNFYTDKTWGMASSYNLCIDTSVLGIEQSANIVSDYALQKVELVYNR